MPSSNNKTRRIALVGGNWKSNGTVATVEELVKGLNEGMGQIDTSKVQVVVAPSAIHLSLPAIRETLDRAVFAVSAQNAYHEKGAFTGEVNLDMLADLGIDWVILGHSERRHVFGETDELIGTKTRHALAHQGRFKIIACIGETMEERNAGKTMEVCQRQLKAFADAVKNEDEWNRIVIAYEPVWSIGTGLTATPDQAQEVNGQLRQWIKENVSESVADRVRILYGGSVKASNASELAKLPDVDGFLVGGASLKAEEFVSIIKSAQEAK